MAVTEEDVVEDLEDDGERRVVDLGFFQSWYTTLQTAHEISHSKVTSSLVHLTGFINLQNLIGDNDNYGLEMAAFLKEDYLKGINLKLQLCMGV